MDSYNMIDLFIVCIVCAGLGLGLWKGCLRSVTALAGLVLGVLLAIRYYEAVTPVLSRITSLDPRVAMIISMIMVFVATQAVFVLIRRAMEALLDFTHLTWLDRILGAGMGAAAGLLVVAAAVQALLVGVPEWPVIKSSKLVKPVEDLTHKAIAFTPAPMKEHWLALTGKWKTSQEPISNNRRQQTSPWTATAEPQRTVK